MLDKKYIYENVIAKTLFLTNNQEDYKHLAGPNWCDLFP